MHNAWELTEAISDVYRVTMNPDYPITAIDVFDTMVPIIESIRTKYPLTMSSIIDQNMISQDDWVFVLNNLAIREIYLA